MPDNRGKSGTDHKTALQISKITIKIRDLTFLAKIAKLPEGRVWRLERVSLWLEGLVLN